MTRGVSNRGWCGGRVGRKKSGERLRWAQEWLVGEGGGDGNGFELDQRYGEARVFSWREMRTRTHRLSSMGAADSSMGVGWEPRIRNRHEAHQAMVGS